MYRRRSRGSVWFGLLLMVPLLIWGGLRVFNYITWSIEVTGHLKRAADANTIALAAREMETVVSYLERNGITSGYTSVLYRTPDEDVGFWYQNLRASLEELRRVPDGATQLEQSNILMKLRETLLDAGETGDTVTEPFGISVYPYNEAYAAFGLATLVTSLYGAWIVFRRLV